MKYCAKCDIQIKNGTLCQTCRRYLNNGGIFYPLPKFGEVEKGHDGKIICHVCGMAFDKLCEHTLRKHKLSDREYKQKFELQSKISLTSETYNKKMSEYTEQYQTHIGNFSEYYGEKRYQPIRQRNSWSEQERKARKQAQINNGKKSKSNLSIEKIKELGKIWVKNLPNKRQKNE